MLSFHSRIHQQTTVYQTPPHPALHTPSGGCLDDLLTSQGSSHLIDKHGVQHYEDALKSSDIILKDPMSLMQGYFVRLVNQFYFCHDLSLCPLDLVAC